jgi:hypothetical protein
MLSQLSFLATQLVRWPYRIFSRLTSRLKSKFRPLK